MSMAEEENTVDTSDDTEDSVLEDREINFKAIQRGRGFPRVEQGIPCSTPRDQATQGALFLTGKFREKHDLLRGAIWSVRGHR